MKNQNQWTKVLIFVVFVALFAIFFVPTNAKMGISQLNEIQQNNSRVK